MELAKIMSEAFFGGIILIVLAFDAVYGSYEHS